MLCVTFVTVLEHLQPECSIWEVACYSHLVGQVMGTLFGEGGNYTPISFSPRVERLGFSRIKRKSLKLGVKLLKAYVAIE